MRYTALQERYIALQGPELRLEYVDVSSGSNIISVFFVFFSVFSCFFVFVEVFNFIVNGDLKVAIINKNPPFRGEEKWSRPAPEGEGF